MPKPSKGERVRGMVFFSIQLPSSSGGGRAAAKSGAPWAFSPGFPDGWINLVLFGPISKELVDLVVRVTKWE